MSHPQNWAEALKINPESLSAWSELAPPGTPLLVWCLEQGHVPLSEYLQWASETYGLPVLRSEFFSENFDGSQLLESQGSWNAWCFPVDSWDGVTIVACVEPPSEKPAENSVAYVLADPNTMHAVWSRSQAQLEAKSADAPPPVTPTSAEDNAPVGVNLNATKTFQLQLDVEDLNAEPGQPSVAVDPHPVREEKPEKMEQTLSIVLDMTKLGAAPAAVQEAPPPVVRASEPKPTNTPNPTVNAVADESDPVTAVFNALKEDYTTALLLRCEDGDAKPFKWDASLMLSTEAANGAVHLNAPSLFRIATKTQMPYHGYVVDSPAHREFFARLGMSELPGCVTAIPIHIDEKLWGILVAIGDESAQGPKPLEKAQKLAEQVTEVLAAQNSKAA